MKITITEQHLIPITLIALMLITVAQVGTTKPVPSSEVEDRDLSYPIFRPPQYSDLHYQLTDLDELDNQNFTQKVVVKNMSAIPLGPNDKYVFDGMASNSSVVFTIYDPERVNTHLKEQKEYDTGAYTVTVNSKKEIRIEEN